MNASRHPGMPPAPDQSQGIDRTAALFSDLRAEYDAALSENKAFSSMRRDLHEKFEQQLHELQKVERSLANLESSHNKLRTDAENEIAILKSRYPQHAHPQQTQPSTVGPPANSIAQDDRAAKDQPAPDTSASNPGPNNPSNPASRPPNGLPTSAPASASPSTMPGPAPPMASAPLPSTASNPASLPPSGVHRNPSQGPIPPMQTIPPSDGPSRPLPSRLSGPLTSIPARTHPDPSNPQPGHPAGPYSSNLSSSFSVSRTVYQSQHPSLPGQLHGLPQHHSQQYHPQSHPDQQGLPHHQKFPRIVTHQHPHHMQLGPHASGPLPPPGTLAGNASSIPSMMSNGTPSEPRAAIAGPHDAQSMGIMTNGPSQRQDERMMANKGARGRVPPPRGAPHTSMLTAPSGQPGSITPSGRSRHPVMTTMDEQPRGMPTLDDWEVRSGRAADGSKVNMNLYLQNSLHHDSVVCCVRYSRDGRYLATGSNKVADIYDPSTGQRISRFVDASRGEDEEAAPGNDSYVRAVCFSPDGEWLITGAEDRVVKIWDIRHRTVKHTLSGHGTDIYSVDASADGRFIISGSGDKKAKLWNLETGMLLRTLGDEYNQGPTDGITSVSVSPTNQLVAAGSLDKVVRVWDVASGHLLRTFEGHRDSVYSVAFSPDGRLLLSGSLDKTLKLWDLSAPCPASCRLTFTGHEDFVLSVAFSPSGKWLISGSKDRTVQFWDPRQSSMCQMLKGHKNSVISIAHNPMGSYLATGSGDCRARTWSYEY